MPTFTEVLARHNITVPDATLAELEVPVLTGPQRQGDVFIWPAEAPSSMDGFTAVPREGVAVVFGEATGNTHRLDADGPVFWSPARQSAGSLLLGTVLVPEGSQAYLIHDQEHGANGMGPGAYRLVGKREQADQIRRVAD